MIVKFVNKVGKSMYDFGEPCNRRSLYFLSECIVGNCFNQSDCSLDKSKLVWRHLFESKHVIMKCRICFVDLKSYEKAKKVRLYIIVLPSCYRSF
jgi:hypothetical protein